MTSISIDVLYFTVNTHQIGEYFLLPAIGVGAGLGLLGLGAVAVWYKWNSIVRRRNAQPANPAN